MPATRVPLILGAGSFGTPSSGAGVSDPTLVQEFIDFCVAHGQCGIDASRVYGNGTAEQLLGSLDLRGFMRVDTKNLPVNPGEHAPDKLKRAVEESCAVLAPHKIRVFYLHAPDKAVPFEETLSAIDQLQKAGCFEEWGVCNFSVPDLQSILAICAAHRYAKPSVFQGPYNLLDRAFESTLIPLLRVHGMRLAAHSPLAGGFLTGKMLPGATYTTPTPTPTPVLSHFDPAWALSSYYTKRYVPMAPALAELQAFIVARGLTLREVAYRWLQHHSAMGPEDHGLVVGARSRQQLESTSLECEKGSLPEDVVGACEGLWEKVRGMAKEAWEP